MGKDKLGILQDKMTSVMKVFNVLDGIDNKIKDKGTIIRPYNPEAFSLLKHFRRTILQYVSVSLLSKSDWPLIDP